MGFNKDFPQWYGGKVRFGGRLKDISTTKTPEYIIILDQPTLGPSSRFLRRFGASSFLRIKIPKSIINKSNNDLMEFFIRPFVMNGEVFRSFYAKDHTVFLFRTNEIAIGTTVTIPVNSFNPSALSLMDFLNWHNPLECNFRQVSIPRCVRPHVLTAAAGYDQMGFSICSRTIYFCARPSSGPCRHNRGARHQ